MTNFDPTKPVQTRDGRKARIICTDRSINAADGWPIIALVKNRTDGYESVTHHNSAGLCLDCEDTDLINIPIRHTVELWVNVYEFGDHEVFPGRDLADAGEVSREENALTPHKPRIACKHITIEVEEGEGLG